MEGLSVFHLNHLCALIIFITHIVYHRLLQSANKPEQMRPHPAATVSSDSAIKKKKKSCAPLT